MSAYFITSCGTDIGKTFVTCALIHAARAKNIEVAAYKPVLSGFDEAWPQISDAGAILEALGSDSSDEKMLDAVAPWRFAAPLSPHMAAAMEGKEIDMAALVQWSRARLNPPSGLTLFEGVGGVMVPLNNTHTVRDWMQALAIPAILVTGNYLGGISHTLTAMEALKTQHIAVAALILCESPDATVPLAETLATYDHFAGDIPLRIAQPRVSSYKQANNIHALLEHLL